MPKTRQIAAIPIRRDEDGHLEVLLVTSRETRRWVVPKGWPIDGKSDAEAAEVEAWEEAGVLGRIGKHPIGVYGYDKRRPKSTVPVLVEVYVLQVSDVLTEWPESRERRRQWFAPEEAAELVHEDELKALLASLA